MNFEFYKLKNGVRVVLVPMTGVESTAIGVYVKTGSRYETDKINGLSHFLEHMVFKGTKKFPTHRETSYLEGLGAIQNAWTDVDATAYWCKIVADKWKPGLELMADLALNPRIPEADLEIERGVILEEINRREDQPDEISAEVLQELLFSDNPLGMTTLGKTEVIKSVCRDDFLAYHRRQYVAGRLAVVMAGKMDKKGARAEIEKLMGRLPAEAGSDFAAVVEEKAGPAVQVYHKKTADQIHFHIGLRCFDGKDRRRFALAILTAYLGQGLSSRLFTELREKRGLCYAVQAGGSHLEDTGVWSVYAGAARSKFKAAVEAVWEEMRRLREVNLTDKELAQAKEKLRGQIIFANENPVRQMEYLGRQALDKPDQMIDSDTLIQCLMGVSRQQIKEVARQLFIKPKLRLAAVGQTDTRMVGEIMSHLRE